MMSAVAVIVIVFTLIQMLVSLANLLTGGIRQRDDKTRDDHVSVLIPARNEEINIRNILDDLRQQDYRNIEILVYDDQSEDATAEAVLEMQKNDRRISLITSEGLPQGWLGKNHACHILAGRAAGRYLLFLDADVRIGKKLIGQMLAFSGRHAISLVSIFPKQIIVTAGEWITVPVMNFILLSLLPLILVRKARQASLSAANGQFMLFSTVDYRKTEPHRLMKKIRAEDIAIAQYYKSQGLKVACLAGNEEIRCRMYSGFRDAVNGFSKNVTAFFGNSFILAISFWLVTSLGFIPVMLAFPGHILFFYLAMVVVTRIFISLASRQNILLNLLFMIPLQASLGIIIYKAFLNNYFRTFEWKGRKTY